MTPRVDPGPATGGGGVSPESDEPLLAHVTVALMVGGLPLESAQKFAIISVDAVRAWLWRETGCRCGADWTVRGLEDPACSAHGYDRFLGGDGSGGVWTVEAAREEMAVVAADLKEQLGEDVYGRVFAPVFAQRLQSLVRMEGSVDG